MDSQRWTVNALSPLVMFACWPFGGLAAQEDDPEEVMWAELDRISTQLADHHRQMEELRRQVTASFEQSRQVLLDAEETAARRLELLAKSHPEWAKASGWRHHLSMTCSPIHQLSLDIDLRTSDGHFETIWGSRFPKDDLKVASLLEAASATDDFFSVLFILAAHTQALHVTGAIDEHSLRLLNDRLIATADAAETAYGPGGTTDGLDKAKDQLLSSVIPILSVPSPHAKTVDRLLTTGLAASGGGESTFLRYRTSLEKLIHAP